MKKILFTLFVIISLLIGNAFSTYILAYSTIKIEANKDYVNKTVELEDFKSINLSCFFTVEYIQSDTERCKAEIYAPSNIIE